MADTANYQILVMTANGWCAASTKESALRQLTSEWGLSHMKRYGYVVYSVHPDFEISEIDGTIYTPKGYPPIKLEDRTNKKKKKD